MATTLFLGGARSGKSRLAQQATEAQDGPLVYCATAEARDAEMADRIARHQADRGARWSTIECPLDIVLAIDAEQRPLLIDCLTLWLTNVMLGDQDVAAQGRALVEAIGRRTAPLFLVSNEVGLGLVPDTPLGRAFRDEQGRLNQIVAAAADDVIFVAAGLPLRMK